MSNVIRNWKDIVLKNVTFRYGNRKPVLKNIRVSRMNATLDEVKKAAKAVGKTENHTGKGFFENEPVLYFR